MVEEETHQDLDKIYEQNLFGMEVQVGRVW